MLFLHPSSRMHFISNNIQAEMRFGLPQTQSELLQLIKQKLAGWTEQQQSTNPSTQPLATVDTRLRVRYLWVAWHLSQRDSPAYLGREGGRVKLETDWVATPVFPLQLNILWMRDTARVTVWDDWESACSGKSSAFFFFFLWGRSATRSESEAGTAKCVNSC